MSYLGKGLEFILDIWIYTFITAGNSERSVNESDKENIQIHSFHSIHKGI